MPRKTWVAFLIVVICSIATSYAAPPEIPDLKKPWDEPADVCGCNKQGNSGRVNKFFKENVQRGVVIVTDVRTFGPNNFETTYGTLIFRNGADVIELPNQVIDPSNIKSKLNGIKINTVLIASCIGNKPGLASSISLALDADVFVPRGQLTFFINSGGNKLMMGVASDGLIPAPLTQAQAGSSAITPGTVLDSKEAFTAYGTRFQGGKETIDFRFIVESDTVGNSAGNEKNIQYLKQAYSGQSVEAVAKDNLPPVNPSSCPTCKLDNGDPDLKALRDKHAQQVSDMIEEDKKALNKLPYKERAPKITEMEENLRQLQAKQKQELEAAKTAKGKAAIPPCNTCKLRGVDFNLRIDGMLNQTASLSGASMSIIGLMASINSLHMGLEQSYVSHLEELNRRDLAAKADEWGRQYNDSSAQQNDPCAKYEEILGPGSATAVRECQVKLANQKNMVDEVLSKGLDNELGGSVEYSWDGKRYQPAKTRREYITLMKQEMMLPKTNNPALTEEWNNTLVAAYKALMRLEYLRATKGGLRYIPVPFSTNCSIALSNLIHQTFSQETSDLFATYYTRLYFDTEEKKLKLWYKTWTPALLNSFRNNSPIDSQYPNPLKGQGAVYKDTWDHVMDLPNANVDRLFVDPQPPELGEIIPELGMTCGPIYSQELKQISEERKYTCTDSEPPPPVIPDFARGECSNVISTGPCPDCDASQQAPIPDTTITPTVPRCDPGALRWRLNYFRQFENICILDFDSATPLELEIIKQSLQKLIAEAALCGDSDDADVKAMLIRVEQLVSGIFGTSVFITTNLADFSDLSFKDSLKEWCNKKKKRPLYKYCPELLIEQYTVHLDSYETECKKNPSTPTMYETGRVSHQAFIQQIGEIVEGTLETESSDTLTGDVFYGSMNDHFRRLAHVWDACKDTYPNTDQVLTRFNRVFGEKARTQAMVSYLMDDTVGISKNEQLIRAYCGIKETPTPVPTPTETATSTPTATPTQTQSPDVTPTTFVVTIATATPNANATANGASLSASQTPTTSSSGATTSSSSTFTGTILSPTPTSTPTRSSGGTTYSSGTSIMPIANGGSAGASNPASTYPITDNGGAGSNTGSPGSIAGSTSGGPNQPGSGSGSIGGSTNPNQTNGSSNSSTTLGQGPSAPVGSSSGSGASTSQSNPGTNPQVPGNLPGSIGGTNSGMNGGIGLNPIPLVPQNPTQPSAPSVPQIGQGPSAPSGPTSGSGANPSPNNPGTNPPVPGSSLGSNGSTNNGNGMPIPGMPQENQPQPGGIVPEIATPAETPRPISTPTASPTPMPQPSVPAQSWMNYFFN